MSLKIRQRDAMLPTLTLQDLPMARPRKPTIELPPHVNVVRIKGRPYYYFHQGRGTKNAVKPTRLPDDPRLPEFWAAYHQLVNEPGSKTSPASFEALIAAYRGSPEFADLADTTRRDYARYLEVIRAAWGQLEVSGLLAAHVLALRDKHRSTPAAANALIRTLSTLLTWSVPRGYRRDNPCQFVRKLSIGEGWHLGLGI